MRPVRVPGGGQERRLHAPLSEVHEPGLRQVLQRQDGDHLRVLQDGGQGVAVHSQGAGEEQVHQQDLEGAGPQIQARHEGGPQGDGARRDQEAPRASVRSGGDGRDVHTGGPEGYQMRLKVAEEARIEAEGERYLEEG